MVSALSASFRWFQLILTYMDMFFEWQKICHFESLKMTKLSTRGRNLTDFNQIKVGENVILDYFVRHGSFHDFVHSVLFLEQGLVKLNSVLNMMPSLTLNAQKSSFFVMSSLGAS